METIDLIYQAVKYLAPPPDITCAEWADKYRYVHSGPYPGKWVTDRTPYLREPLECVTDSRVEQIVIIKPTRIGGTEIVNQAIGYHIHYDPCSMLYVQTSLDEGRKYSNEILMPAIDATPVLRETIKRERGRKASQTKLFKSFPGGNLTIVGAASPKGFRMVSKRIVICDDIDGYEDNPEGDPVELAIGRSKDYWNRKIILVSNPTIKGASRIEKYYEQSDQRKYYVPCSHCGEYQIMKFGGKDTDYGLKWKKDSPEVWYLCEHCHEKIEEYQKNDMALKGIWKADAEFNGIAGFFLNPFLCSWHSWRLMKNKFLHSKDDPTKLKTFINQWLGELWEEKGESPEWHQVAFLRIPYKLGEIPDGIRYITCGVDVGKRNLIYAVRGWGVNAESWLIEHGELWGDTDKQTVWNTIAELLTKDYQGKQITRMLLDSGYRPEMIYEFCRKHPAQAVATKGQQTQDRPIKMNLIDITLRGKTIKHGLKLWHVHTDYFKSWVHGRLNFATTDSGAWHLPIDTTDDYCKQMVAESLVISPTGKRIWIKHDIRNHYFDTEVLNSVGAHILGVHMLKGTSQVVENQTSQRRRVLSKGIG